MTFDPNAAAGEDSGIFGLPTNFQEAALVYVPVPWEGTTSYGKGTSKGPSAIEAASRQVDLYDPEVLRPYEAGLFMLEHDTTILPLNSHSKEDSSEINLVGARINNFVYERTKELLSAGKIASIIGGEHSVPFGAIKAIAEQNRSFGILHVDAHSDTRRAFEGLTWSHASIMFNVLEQIPNVSRLTQVAIRDFCEDEFNYCRKQGDRVAAFFDHQIMQQKFEGKAWAVISEKIVSSLPEKVWISFDIDGLDPALCPHTGTPVPGGLQFSEAVFLISAVVKSGRTIIGFDLCEVAPGENDEWDANVAARLLYKLSAWTLASQGKAKLIPQT